MMKKLFENCDLQSNKYDTQLQIQLSARREFYDINTTVYSC